jgi:hypothetical protein
MIYLERLKRFLSTERGLRLTFSSGRAEESIEMSAEAAAQVLNALERVRAAEHLTVTVEGHQIMRRADAYGLLLRTQEFGDVIFSLPQPIIQRLADDLKRLASSFALPKTDKQKTRRVR